MKRKDSFVILQAGMSTSWLGTVILITGENTPKAAGNPMSKLMYSKEKGYTQALFILYENDFHATTKSDTRQERPTTM